MRFVTLLLCLLTCASAQTDPVPVSPRPALCGKTSPLSGGCDVIERGAPASDNPVGIPADRSRLDIYMILNLAGCIGQDCLGSQNIVATVASQSTGMQVSLFHPADGQFQVLEGFHSDLVMAFQCNADGDFDFSVTLELSTPQGPLWDTVRLQYTKTCQVTTNREGFFVAHWPSAPVEPMPLNNAIEHGATHNAWSHFPLEDMVVYTSPRNNIDEPFAFFLQPTLGFTDSMPFKVNVQFDESFLDVTVESEPTHDQSYVASTTRQGNGVPSNWMSIQASCKVTAPRLLDITVNLFDITDPVGINTTYYTPQHFFFYKNCFALPVDPTDAPSSGGGMSGFGVFCLVMFCLIMAACMGGCAYKYQARGERGVEVIPGIDTYRGVYSELQHRLCKKPSHDELDEYDTPDNYAVNSDTGYNASDAL